MSRRVVPALLLFLLVLSCGSGSAAGTEQGVRVTNFHARVLVGSDGTIRVKETMRILTGGETFTRSKGPMLSGIYRSMLGRIQGRHAYYHLKGFEVAGATLDGAPIPYSVHTTGTWFAKYIFLGPEQFSLSPGVHELTLEYAIDRQVNFLTDHDELFLWVFGEGMHGWVKSVDTVAVTVVLPYGGTGIIDNLDDHSWSRGTGKIPALLRRASGSESANVLHYGTVLTQKKPYLSVVVSMPRGTVQEPNLSRRIAYFFRDLTAYLPGLIGLTLFFAYYLFVWARVGRDPKGRSIVPRYRPPEDCSPAVARRLLTMGYDRTTFAAALLDLAARGLIKISRRGNGYVVQKLHNPTDSVPADEQVLFDALLRSKGDETTASPKEELDPLTIHRAYRRHRRYLASTIDKRFFLRNARYLIPGILFSLIVAAINAEIVDVRGGYVREMISLSLWMIVAGSITRFLSRKKVLELRRPSKFVYLVLLFPLVLYSAAVALSYSVGIFSIMKFMFLLPLVIMMTAHVVFFFLLRAPTPLGRKAMDEIQGFRTYLAAAEGDRLDRMNPPEKTPALFETYLPYALALGVENRWSSKFSGEVDETYTLPPLDLFLGTLSRFFSGRRG
jgi:hypothetical protein